ncbi:MAG: heavy metal translocating P-type ATPase, partial [Prevotella sp.]|nr:heavy metal translocating P-type ATPase [Prevotella sp.]
MTKKQKTMLIRIIVAALLTAVLALLPDITVLPLGNVAHGLLYYIVVYLIIGYDILRKALLGIRNSRVFDENFLMVVATLGAFALALYEQSGDYLEAIAVMLFYQVGEFFQSYAVGKSRRDIT